MVWGRNSSQVFDFAVADIHISRLRSSYFSIVLYNQEANSAVVDQKGFQVHVCSESRKRGVLTIMYVYIRGVINKLKSLATTPYATLF